MQRPQVVWWKAALGILGGLLLLAAAGGGWFAWSVHRAWQAMLRDVEALSQIERERAVERPVLRPALHSGNAADAYLEAVGLGFPQHAADLRDWFDPLEFPYEVVVVALLEDSRPHLALLARGARSSTAVFRPGDDVLGDHSSLSDLALQGALDAAWHWEKGRRREAVDRLLDVLQFGRDCVETWEGGDDVYASAIGYAEKLIARWVRSGLDADGLEAFREALKALDAQPPSLESLCRRRALLFAAILRRDDARDNLESFLWWYHDRKNPSSENTVYLRMLALGAWRKIRAEADRVPQQAASHPVVLSKEGAMEWVGGTRWTHYRCMTRIRLLRMGIEWASGRPIPPLEDPYGGTLIAEHEEGAVSVTSRSGLSFRVSK